MGYLLSFVFMNAWISQFYVGMEGGIDQAKDLAESITSLAMIVGLFFGIFIGYLIDNSKIVPYIALCFLLRLTGLLLMTCFITDFEKQKMLLYVSFFAITIGTFCQTIVVQGLLNKRLIGPIKEITNGLGQVMRGIGVMVLTGAGGFLAQTNVNGPFALVAWADVFFLVFLFFIVVVMGAREK